MTKEDFFKLRPQRLAEITGDFPASWLRWLKGERSPSYKSLQNAAEKLEMSLDDLTNAIEERRLIHAFKQRNKGSIDLCRNTN